MEQHSAEYRRGFRAAIDYAARSDYRLACGLVEHAGKLRRLLDQSPTPYDVAEVAEIVVTFLEEFATGEVGNAVLQFDPAQMATA